MKKLLLSITAFAIFGIVNAQTIQLNNPTLNVPGTTNDWDLEAHVDVMNIGNTAIDITCERTTNVLAAGHQSSFCWGVACYPTSVNLSATPVNLASGATSNSFIGHLTTGYVAGVSNVTYCFYDQNNVTNSSCVTFQYNITLATGIDDNDSKPSMTAPHPNPSDRFTNIGYTLKGAPETYQLVLYNMLGSKMSSFNFKAKTGVVIIPTESLQSGVYFCSLKQGEKVIGTQKLIVSHK